MSTFLLGLMLHRSPGSPLMRAMPPASRPLVTAPASRPLVTAPASRPLVTAPAGRPKPKRSGDWVLVWLLVPCVGVFACASIAQSENEKGDPRLLQWMFRHCAVSLHNDQRGRWWTLITAAFTHFDAEHLGGNTGALLLFGQRLLTAISAPAFLGLYFSSVLAGSIASLSCKAFIQRRDGPSIGASGGVSGIMLVAALVNPAMTMLTEKGAEEPAWTAIIGHAVIDGIAVLCDCFGVARPAKLAMVDCACHLGGYAAATVFYWLGCRPRGFFLLH